MTQHSLLPSLWGKDKDNGFNLRSLQRDVERVFDQFNSSFPANLGLGETSKTGFLVPKINISESENAVEIVAEIPGVDKDQIDVSVTDDILTIKGEKKTEHEEKKKDYRLVERSSGSFYRSIPLGFDIDPETVETDFKDGVLTLIIPKPPELEKKVKKIKINSAA